MNLIGTDIENIKEAIATGHEDAYFRMIVPEEGQRVHLVGSKRVIREESEGDHAISNQHVGLVRLCSSGEPSGTDFRFLHQEGQIAMADQKQTDFHDESELRDACLPTLCAFFDSAYKIATESDFHLPQIDVEFELVTDSLVKVVQAWLDFDWFALPLAKREAFTIEWGGGVHRRAG